MDGCVFCQIVAAFLDIRPRSPGHTLVVPKKHERWVWEVEPQSEYWLLARRIARAQEKAFHTDAVWCTVIGDEVPHAHIWIYPHPETKGNRTDLPGNARKLRQALEFVAG